MKTVIIQLPGLNRDRDMIAAIIKISGKTPQTIWYTETSLPEADLYIIPGGFSFGDYLRAGAIAARAPVLNDLKARADKGHKVLGVCNGFQILTEAGLLPGALMRNKDLKFVCKSVRLKVTNAATDFTGHYQRGQVIDCPVAHHDGNYFADNETLKTLQDKDRIIFRYAEGTNPNGSLDDIAGIINQKGNVLGMMPHPENLIEEAHQGTDGRALFESLLVA